MPDTDWESENERRKNLASNFENYDGHVIDCEQKFEQR
jgi:hypothetical protein